MRKFILIFALAASGFLFLHRAHAGQEQSKLWAAISVSDALFLEGWTKDLRIHFTLVNDGRATINPKIESSRLIINGKEIENSGFTFGKAIGVVNNGVKDANWDSLPPGGALRFAYALETYFKTPGIYRVSWKGEDFESPTIVFRVIKSKLPNRVLSFESFKREMMPKVGQQITVTGVLKIGKLGWFIAFNDWGVYIRAIKNSDISKMNDLNRFEDQTVQVTGILRYFPEPLRPESDVPVAIPPEHFYFVFSEAKVISLNPPRSKHSKRRPGK